MGVNYYAEFSLEDGGLSTAVVYRMHLGKSTTVLNEDGESREGFSTFSGKHFPSVKAWQDFLTFNRDCVTIVDEYGEKQELEEFVANFLNNYSSCSSRSQVEWLEGSLLG